MFIDEQRYIEINDTWFEKSCHFPQWSENKKFNNVLINMVNSKK